MNNLPFAVVPVLIGPLQVLFALLPYILLALGGLLVGLLKPRVLLVLAVLAALVVGSVFLVRTIFFSSGTGPVSEQVAGADWPMFRGDAGRRGNGRGATSRPRTAGWSGVTLPT